MNRAFIYYDGPFPKDYCGDGPYILSINSKTEKKCKAATRNKANKDLVRLSKKSLDKFKIDEVLSNNKVVWSRNDERS